MLSVNQADSLKPGVYIINSGNARNHGRLILFEDNTYAIMAVNFFAVGRWVSSNEGEVTFTPIATDPFSIYGRKGDNTTEVKLVNFDADVAESFISFSNIFEESAKVAKIEFPDTPCDWHYHVTKPDKPINSVSIVLKDPYGYLKGYQVAVPQGMNELVIFLNDLSVASGGEAFKARYNGEAWHMERGEELKYLEGIDKNSEDMLYIIDLKSSIENNEIKYLTDDCYGLSQKALDEYFIFDETKGAFYLDSTIDLESIMYDQPLTPESERLILLLQGTANPIFRKFEILPINNSKDVSEDLIDARSTIPFKCE